MVERLQLSELELHRYLKLLSRFEGSSAVAASIRDLGTGHVSRSTIDKGTLAAMIGSFSMQVKVSPARYPPRAEADLGALIDWLR